MIFLILTIGGSEYNLRLAATIQQHFPQHFALSSNEWLVASSIPTTAKDVSDKLGISVGTFGTAAVFSITGYWGFAPNNVWEFISGARLKNG